MTPEQFQQWLAHMHWRRNRAGAELDISPDRLRRFVAGESHIPRHIALACMALAMGAQPWPVVPPDIEDQ